jgi:hypothetical protein
MAKHKKKEKADKKSKKRSANRNGATTNSEVDQLRKENAELKARLTKIAELAELEGRRRFPGDADEDAQYTEVAVDVDDAIEDDNRDDE